MLRPFPLLFSSMAHVLLISHLQKGFEKVSLYHYTYLLCVWKYFHDALTYLPTTYNGNQLILQNKDQNYPTFFFADDIILFSEITPKSCNAVIDVINYFSKYSGQWTNFEKSKLFLSKNCTINDKDLALSSSKSKKGTTLVSTSDFLFSIHAQKGKTSNSYWTTSDLD